MRLLHSIVKHTVCIGSLLGFSFFVFFEERMHRHRRSILLMVLRKQEKGKNPLFGVLFFHLSSNRTEKSTGGKSGYCFLPLSSGSTFRPEAYLLC